jgi:hypothetical protein
MSQATSVAVERVFSRGRLLVSHIRNRLSPQSIRALLCLNSWCSIPALIQDADVATVVSLPIVEGDEDDIEMEDGWDAIVLPSKVKG